MVRKFGENDRERVRLALEQFLGIKLTRPGRRRKVMVDEAGRVYWIMGYGDWHGIEPDMIDDLAPAHDALLVIARRMKRTIRLFAGPLRPILQNLEQLTVAESGQLQFNLKDTGGKLIVKEVPQATLDLLTEFKNIDCTTTCSGQPRTHQSTGNSGYSTSQPVG